MSKLQHGEWDWDTLTDNLTQYSKNELEEWGQRIDVPRLAEVLREAHKIWPVSFTGNYSRSPLLTWNMDDVPVEHEEALTGDSIRPLADAIDYLASKGLPVTLGQSARGYTYLNIQVWQSDYVSVIEAEEEEGESE